MYYFRESNNNSRIACKRKPKDDPMKRNCYVELIYYISPKKLLLVGENMFQGTCHGGLRLMLESREREEFKGMLVASHATNTCWPT